MLNLLQQVWHEFHVEVAELSLYMKDERDETFEVLLVRLEVFVAHHDDHTVRQLVELHEQYVIGTVDDNLGQGPDRALLHRLVPALLQDVDGEHFEVALERSQLLLLVFDA